MEELQQCRVQQRNIATTIDKLTHCLPGRSLNCRLYHSSSANKHTAQFVLSVYYFSHNMFFLPPTVLKDPHCFHLNSLTFAFIFLASSSPGDVQQTTGADEGQKVCN